MVTAIMLTRGRPDMARRAIKSFQIQTYERKRLVIVNSGDGSLDKPIDGRFIDERYLQPSLSIGEMRNIAARECADKDEMILHWDDDDWSHPARIAEQVALLQESGADAVGYNQMLFWDTSQAQCCGAWLYENPDPGYILGTSLCYWRRTWERKSFPHISAGEDTQWIVGLKRIGVDSVLGTLPRMIASIHGGNSSSRVVWGAKEWSRVPGWDAHCREVMAL